MAENDVKAPADERAKWKGEAWVNEAYKIFFEDAEGIDPTDPVAALQTYFDAHASDDLKARCQAEGKTAKACWKFVQRVASKALKGTTGHVDPGVVYAVAMHWFEDVPADWDAPEPKPEPKKKPEPEKKSEPENKPDPKQEPKPARIPAKKPSPKKPRHAQGFFFEMLENAPAGGEGGGEC